MLRPGEIPSSPYSVAACPSRPCHFVGNLRPESVFVLAHDSAIQNDSPLLLFRRRKAQALERNRHPHHKAAAGHFAPRIPHRVERRIEISIDLLRVTPRSRSHPTARPAAWSERHRPAAGRETYRASPRPDRRRKYLRAATCAPALSSDRRSTRTRRRDFSGRSPDRLRSPPKLSRHRADCAARSQ